MIVSLCWPVNTLEEVSQDFSRDKKECSEEVALLAPVLRAVAFVQCVQEAIRASRKHAE